MITIYVIVALLTALYIYKRPGFNWTDRERISLLILGALFWPVFWLLVLYVALMKVIKA